jgi:glyoxylase-like metal-dependent hydrolase (beta-lactamase superfamily II)
MKLHTDFEPRHGEPVQVAANVARVTAPNPGPLTFHGTNTYLVGAKTLAIIDPGPALPAHEEALKRAIGGRPVSHIFVTHTHRDHSELADRLAALTGAVTAAEGPHRWSRDIGAAEINHMDASADADFVPGIAVAHGQSTEGDGWRIEAVLTPGHAANHCAFDLAGTGILFSGDHVMAWATTIVAPPDGSMRDYLASLDLLLGRKDRLYLPGHGGALHQPHAFVKGLKSHRKMRERAILQRIKEGDRAIAAIVAALYSGIDPSLRGAAGLSVLAHLEDLTGRGLVKAEGGNPVAAVYRLA